MRYSFLTKKWMFLPAVLLGVIVLVVMVKSKGAPPKAPIREKARAVRVIKAPKLAVLPKAVGWGYVQPGQVWSAVAEVSGRIVEINPRLKKGAIILKDELLIRIDPAQRKTAEKQADAVVKNLLARLEELERKEENARSQISVERKALEITRKELERHKTLVKSGVISPSEVDVEEKVFLTQQNKVRNYANTLNLIPAEREALMAEIVSARSKLDDTRLDLEKTEIRAPFDCRISREDIELGQAVNVGQVLAETDSMAVSEVFAQIPISAMRKIVKEIKKDALPFRFKDGKIDMDSVLKRLGLSAVVRLDGENGPVEWAARVARISESIDSKTRSVGLYVAVDNPYDQSLGANRPPLIRNMYGQVIVSGMPREPRVVIPRAALHENIVYVAGADNRLERRLVEVDYSTGRLVSVVKGIAPDEKVVVSDLVPAVKGMLLEPVDDEKTLNSLINEAVGANSVK